VEPRVTTRLYYEDAYLTAFDARVADRSDDGRTVYLDHSAFYPTSGGQPHDIGSLGTARVIDVVDEGERVAHRLDAPLDAAAGAVHGAIDWTRRFDHMQQHTGQHLLSAVFADLFGHETVSVHFGPETSTLDLDVEAVSRDRMLAAERQANAIVLENRPVAVSFEDAATAAGLRKATDRTGVLRVVTIAGLDRSACGGTHVRATGEIGPVLLRRQERVRKAARIEFLCGWRALRRARADYDALAGIAGPLSAGIDELPELIAAQRTQCKDEEAARRKLESELAEIRARERHAAMTPGGDGIRRWVERRPTGSPDALRGLALAFTALPGAAFIGAVADPPAVLFATSADSGLDAGRMLKAALGEVGGRGGGSPRLAQGSVPTAEALEAIVVAIGGPAAGA
jgi:alanyl-tRNA synthetase